jgi:hypothetical protein
LPGLTLLIPRIKTIRMFSFFRRLMKKKGREKLLGERRGIEAFSLSNLTTEVKPLFGLRELNHEEKEQIIEHLSELVASSGLEVPCLILLEIIKPLSEVVSILLALPAAPLLEFFGLPGYTYVSLFQKSENIDLLIKRINEKTELRSAS